MNIYDIPNKQALLLQGWKQRADGTYQGWKKKDLIDEIRCLEHNWAGEIKANKLLSWRLEQSMQKIEVLKKIIKEIKLREPYCYEGDYDWEENLIDKYEPLNIDEIIENGLKAVEYKNFYKELMGEGKYFTEEEQDAEKETIQKMALEPKNNIFDYYEEKIDGK